jgi:hypothetical protein
VAIKNETNSQNQTNTPIPTITAPDADQRPDIGNSGGDGHERAPVTGTIAETTGVKPNNTDEVITDEEDGAADTVAGKRTAAVSSEE